LRVAVAVLPAPSRALTVKTNAPAWEVLIALPDATVPSHRATVPLSSAHE
jgi:hypothetical protein